MPSKSHPLTEKHYNTVQLWKQGYSIDELAPMFGVTRMSILNWIKKVLGHATRTIEEANLANDRKSQKFKTTIFEKYGVTGTMAVHSIREKSKMSLINRFGVDSPCKSPEILEKRKQTYLTRYGTEHPMKTPSICKKSQSKRTYTKSFVFKSGDVVQTQGNGIFALSILESQGYSANEIQTEVWSDVKYNSGGKQSTHIFDIFIPKENRVIEVKGTHPKYGYFADKEMCHIKASASTKMGYKYEIWVFDKQGTHLEIINP